MPRHKESKNHQQRTRMRAQIKSEGNWSEDEKLKLIKYVERILPQTSAEWTSIAFNLGTSGSAEAGPSAYSGNEVEQMFHSLQSQCMEMLTNNVPLTILFKNVLAVANKYVQAAQQTTTFPSGPDDKCQEDPYINSISTTRTEDLDSNRYDPDPLALAKDPEVELKSPARSNPNRLTRNAKTRRVTALSRTWSVPSTSNFSNKKRKYFSGKLYTIQVADKPGEEEIVVVSR